MFSSIGWPEIIALLVIGIIFVGPERLPRIIEDVRAAIYAARKAIANAKAELNGEFDGLGDELEEFRKPLSQVAQFRKLGPRGMLTKALFDGDEEFMDSFNPNRMMQDDTAGDASRRGENAPVNRVERDDQAIAGRVRNDSAEMVQESNPAAPQRPTFDYSKIYSQKPEPKPEPRPDSAGLEDVT